MRRFVLTAIVLISIAVGVGTATSAQAATIVTWNIDTTFAFDMTFTGTGRLTSPGEFFFGDGGPFMSPSGMWRISSGDNAIWRTQGFNANLWEFEGGARVTFIPDFGFGGGKTLDFQTYHDFFPNVLPLGDGNGATGGELRQRFGWQAGTSTRITSEPDPNDPTTWTWEIRYSGSGPNLNVPESDTFFLSLAGMLGVFGVALKRRKSLTYLFPMD